MKRIVGIATMAGREHSLDITIESLKNQVDEILVYPNQMMPVDLTDNGKFRWLEKYKEPIIYFSCDDDLTYPVTYGDDIEATIEKYSTIVTHHGRRLVGTGRNYYTGHRAFRFTSDTPDGITLDVPGTGVTAFRTDYFNPTGIWKAEDKRMSDLVFALEAAKQGKIITLLGHKEGYIRQNPIDLHKTIAWQEWRKCDRQGEIADEIYRIKYESN